MAELNILKRSIQILCSGLDLDNRQRFYFLSKFLEDNDPAKEGLKRELNDIITNKEFDLVGFVSENDELLENPDSYSREELINYLKRWLWSYLYPQDILTEEQIRSLGNDVNEILEQHVTNGGWMFSYEVYDTLKLMDKYKQFEYNDLWKIDFKKQGVERKPIEGKQQEIGYLKYTKR